MISMGLVVKFVARECNQGKVFSKKRQNHNFKLTFFSQYFD